MSITEHDKLTDEEMEKALKDYKYKGFTPTGL